MIKFYKNLFKWKDKNQCIRKIFLNKNRKTLFLKIKIKIKIYIYVDEDWVLF